jgi:tRNA G18 (ribose-2'-O)-methylase SpoU
VGDKSLHHKIAKTALGSEKIIAFEYYKQTWRLIDKLKKEKVFIVALEQNKKAINYLEFKPKFPLALVIGNEVNGVSSQILKKSDKIIYLPMKGVKESLNVAVAFGIAGYHIRNPKL